MAEEESRSQEQESSSETADQYHPSIGIDAKRNQQHDAYATIDEAYYRDAQFDHFVGEFFRWLHSKKTQPHEWIMAFSSIVMLIVVGWQVYSSPTSGQTQQLIDQAKIQAAAAEKFRVAAEGINLQVGNAVGKLGDQVGQLGANVTQTGRLADETGNANQNVVDADRPWMGGAIAVSDFEVGKKPVYVITFINSGKRPARLSLTATRENAYQIFPAQPDKEYIFDTTPSTSVIVPGQPSVSIGSSETEITQTAMDILKGGTYTFFVFAKVEYTDLRTNAKHWTHICERFIPKFKLGNDNGWRNCQEYNDAE
jgi:hypothetical protein